MKETDVSLVQRNAGWLVRSTAKQVTLICLGFISLCSNGRDLSDLKTSLVGSC